MKITKKDIEEAITQVAGEKAVSIYRLLKGKKDVNEFELTQKLKLPINNIRNILYKLEKYNLLHSARRKDKKKGWYIYFWTFNEKRLSELVIKLKIEKLERLQKLLDVEEVELYSCANKCVSVDLNNALEYGYVCPECGLPLNAERIKKNKTKLVEEIKKLKKELDIKVELLL